MFSSKENINIFTSLLVSHGIRCAVVCPGSRNAPIVHNMREAGINCYPVTDERSAGFFAIGICLATNMPVVVCVTSGTALLNLAPAAAEALYQHVPLVIVSADRPAQWIGQLDGQTLPQPNALGSFVVKAVTLPEPVSDEQQWYCNRLVNEALLAAFPADDSSGAPVHINIPVSEPLFDFTVAQLPEERIVRRYSLADLTARFLEARRPMIIVGQSSEAISENDIERLGAFAVVVCEPLGYKAMPYDMLLHSIHTKGLDDDFRPDYVVHLGNAIVSKRLKHFLRVGKTTSPEIWRISPDGDTVDTFMRLTGVIRASTVDALAHIIGAKDSSPFVGRWKEGLKKAERRILSFVPPYSEMAAVCELESQLEEADYEYSVHYANSSAVRLASLYAHHHIFCNRGTNGIEGSLSTAAGYAAATRDMVFCVVGDLSFFYDENALWNRNLGYNLRIMLLNNGGGAIFRSLKGLSDSPSRDDFVAAAHGTKAQGISVQNDVGYIAAHNKQELVTGVQLLINSGTARPLVLEVFTDPDEDNSAWNKLYDF